MKYSKEQIIDEIKRIAQAKGQRFLTSNNYQKESSISLSTVRYHFGSWNEAIMAAGLEKADSLEILSSYNKQHHRLHDDELLRDLIVLWKSENRKPTDGIVNAKGKYSVRPYKKRWGSVAKALLLAQKKFGNELSLSDEQETLLQNEIKVIPETIKPKHLLSKNRQIVYGEPINFQGLQYAPVNEQGVVYLFGMLARQLGFLIESVRTGFPDCEGKRCFDKVNNQWEHVKIEFEFRSSNFEQHGHNPELCDLIVCWIHDWNESPLEILELSKTIKYL